MTSYQMARTQLALLLGLSTVVGLTCPAPIIAADDVPQPPFVAGMQSSDGTVALDRLPISAEVDINTALQALPPPPAIQPLFGLAPPIDAEKTLKALAMPEPPDLPQSLLAAPAPARDPSRLAEALREQVQTLQSITGAEAEALREAYASNGNQPLFVGADMIGERAESLMARLQRAGDDGLNTELFTITPPSDTDANTLAAFDIRLARLAILYARQASGGQVEANRLSGNITVSPDVISPSEALAALSAAHDPSEALEAFNPPHAGFRALRATLADLRITAADKGDNRQIAVVLANMERWRWVPRNIGATHIWVNIPEYMARVNDDGLTTLETRVVVGKPQNQTPVFSHEMETVVINPAWNVPPSILAKEMLGAARRDANYFANRGYQVIKNGRVIDPHSVDWTNPGRVAVRQPPGERNALGKLKFLFPNRHAVYLHDTPSRALFANDYRAYSHGCVRVQQPSLFAETVLNLANPDEGWSKSRIESLYGSGERAVKMKRKIPIHIVYFTAMVTADGKLMTLPDIYGHDARVTQALTQKLRMAELKDR